MLEYTLNLTSYFYGIPIVYRVTKRTLMGNLLDKTFDYISGIDFISPMGEDFVLDYTVNGSNYKIHCVDSTFKEAESYIKNTTVTKNRILNAYHFDGESPVDITSKILKFAGPRCDFYNGTPFEVKSEYIASGGVFILTDDLNLHYFIDDDVIKI